MVIINLVVLINIMNGHMVPTHKQESERAREWLTILTLCHVSNKTKLQTIVGWESITLLAAILRTTILADVTMQDT